MALLELINVNKIYNQGKIIALHGIDLVVEKGEFITIFGPSGSGKTTLLNIISVLDKPTSGRFFFDGIDLLELDSKDLGQYKSTNIGYIPRNNVFIPDKDVFQNLRYNSKLIGKDKYKTKNRLIKILHDVGLNGLENRRPNELNNCQKKRLAIAMAIVKEPVLLLADEPTVNQDSKASNEIMEILVKITEDLGITLIYSTKNRQIIDYAYRIIGINEGMITNNERTEENDMLCLKILETLLFPGQIV